MSGELSLLKCWRSEDHFDLGELKLPFDRRVKLWKWWHYPLVLILILILAFIGYRSFEPSFVRSELEYHGSMWLVGAVLATVFVGGFERPRAECSCTLRSVSLR